MPVAAIMGLLAYMFTRLTGEVAEWLKAAVC